ncbi:MAG: hypothetical protein CML06_10940 [Pseudomonadales bacterium]|nr:hypothetical protein [Pseudomonadales bacterium]
MIDLPGGPPTTTRPESSNRSQPVAAGSAGVPQSEAVSARVVASQASRGADGKPVYELLLQARSTAATASATAPSTTAPPTETRTDAPLTRITPAAIEALRQGQSLLIRAEAGFALAQGARVQAIADPRQGLRVQQILPPQVAARVDQALKALVPQQQGLSPLFRVLEQLGASPELSRALPPRLQTQIQALLQQLPRPHQLQGAGQMQQAVRNSGLFREQRLQQAVREALQPATGRGQTAGGARESGGSASTGLAAMVRQLKAAISPGNTAPRETSGSTPGPGAPANWQQWLGADLKHQLQQLQKQLEQAPQSQRPAVAPDAAQRGGAEPALGRASTGTPDRAVTTGPNLPPTGPSPAGKGPASPGAGPAAEARPGAPPAGKGPGPQTGVNPQTGATTQTTERHGAAFVPAARPPGSAAYSNSASAPGPGPTPQPPGSGAPDPLLLPPLPGNIPLQPQGRARLPAGSDMADALVSVLLKQVKGALARINLHQLASQPRSQEPGAPPPLLSFELPILHQGQVQVFQFRIEQQEAEPEASQRQLGKRWVVQMAFDIEGLGPMLCQISMLGQNAGVTFWAKWEQTLQQTREHFAYLQEVLTDMGLRVDTLEGHLGIPPSEKAILHNQLVDIRT